MITFVGNRLAGSQDGVGQSAGLRNPQGLCLDETRNILYIADTVGYIVTHFFIEVVVSASLQDNHLIRRVPLPESLVN